MFSYVVAIGGAVAVGTTAGYLMARARQRAGNAGLSRHEMLVNVVGAGLLGFVIVALAPRVFSSMREPVWHGGVAHVTQVEEINSVIINRDQRPVLVYFYASWCVPCRMMAPNVEELGNEGYRVMAVDVDQAPYVAKVYNIRTVPTVFVFKDGAIAYSAQGYHSVKTLRRVMR